MLSNEQRAHDFAMLMARYELERRAVQHASGEDTPSTPFIDLYFDAYEQVLSQMDVRFPKEI